MLGNMPQLTGNADKDIIALYDYIIALRKELYDLLHNLDDDNFNKITAQSIDTSTLKVGVNIELDPSAVISFEQIADMPTIYSADDIRNTIITKEWIGTLGLLVGNEIQMGSNAYISWGQIDGVPIDLVYSDALNDYVTKGTLSDELMDYVTSTELTTTLGEDYIITGKIAANQIASGRIDAQYLATDISQVNNILNLGEGYQSYSALSFVGIGGIEAYDNNLVISAMEGISIPTSTFFGNSVYFDGNVNFDNANVSGLKVRLG